MTPHFIQNRDLLKFPRTSHLENSCFQQGDEGYDCVPYSTIAGQFIVVEEKLDGSNSGLSFSHSGELLLQSRGHYLTGSERQFNIFRQWATAHENPLIACLEDRYIAFGEWLYKKHSVFYDALPHFWTEFDIWDRRREIFLDTASRKAMLQGGPVLSVPILFSGIAPKKLDDLLTLITPSYAKTAHWRTRFEDIVRREGLDLVKAWAMADKSDLMEGLYIKVEEEGQVKARYKFVRQDFVQAIAEAAIHHSKQPFIPNQLAPGVDLFSPTVSVTWETLGLVTKQVF
jgi:hypothetical protein